MTIKVRLALLFAGLSLILLVGTLGSIYYSHANSRQTEFFERLRSQCYRVATLLSEVKAVDRDLLRVVDRNSIHRMYNEKVLLFNEKNVLMYSSLDDQPIPYSKELIDRIRKGGELAYHDQDGDDIVGVHYNGEGNDYVVLASAFDEYGQRELRNLSRTLLLSLFIGSLFIFGASYFYIGLAFRPIDRLSKAISGIDVDKLDQRIPVHNSKDEIDQLAVSYNLMLERLRQAFDLQRAFVNNASHELRTPLARMNAQVERGLSLPLASEEIRPILRTLQNDIAAQGGLVESLLLLQRLRSHIPTQRSLVRVDEALFASIEDVRTLFPGLHVGVDISEGITEDRQLIISINELLLRTAFRNLLQNAALYSADRHLEVELEAGKGILVLYFRNAGLAALPSDRVFEPFFRGPGAAPGSGSGLGLSIVQQVVEDAGGHVQYDFQDGHRFTLELPLVH